MVIIKKSMERGRTQTEWLDSFHSFSFGDYYDPNYMGFSSLRVINEDKIAPGKGFETHFHRDMEIISLVLSGALEHKDSMENTSVIQSGDVQVMTAGQGIRHSEFNHSQDQEVHFLQIWVAPDKDDYEPRYDQKAFAERMETEDFVLLVSQDGQDDSLMVHQDVKIFAGKVDSGGELSLGLDLSRRSWVQIIKGEMVLNGHELKAGDAIGLVYEEAIEICAQSDCRFLLFDLL